MAVFLAAVMLLLGERVAWAKRGPAPVVKQVTSGSIRYSAPLGPEQMGMVVATDAGSGKELWRQRIYRVTIDPIIETDVQWVFITDLAVKDHRLLVRNERGQSFLVDPATRKVTRLQTPPASDVSATPAPHIPKHFTAFIGGFLGPSCKTELEGGVIVCTTFPSGYRNPKRIAIRPNATQWIEFRQTLDGLNVWKWRSDYPNHGLDDGTQWSLDIAYPDHSIKTHGDNNYPDAHGKPNGKPEMTTAFRLYLDALEKLTVKK